MSKKKIKPEDNISDMQNKNGGTSGINKTRKKVQENNAEILNPNNDKYWKSRGLDKRPDNWEELINK